MFTNVGFTSRLHAWAAIGVVMPIPTHGPDSWAFLKGLSLCRGAVAGMPCAQCARRYSYSNSGCWLNGPRPGHGPASGQMGRRLRSARYTRI